MQDWAHRPPCLAASLTGTSSQQCRVSRAIKLKGALCLVLLPLAADCWRNRTGSAWLACSVGAPRGKAAGELHKLSSGRTAAAPPRTVCAACCGWRVHCSRSRAPWASPHPFPCIKLIKTNPPVPPALHPVLAACGAPEPLVAIHPRHMGPAGPAAADHDAASPVCALAALGRRSDGSGGGAVVCIRCDCQRHQGVPEASNSGCTTSCEGRAERSTQGRRRLWLPDASSRSVGNVAATDLRFPDAFAGSNSLRAELAQLARLHAAPCRRPPAHQAHCSICRDSFALTPGREGWLRAQAGRKAPALASGPLQPSAGTGEA